MGLEVREYLVTIVESFIGLEEALPDPKEVSEEKFWVATATRDKALGYFIRVILPRVGTDEQYLAYQYFGWGNVSMMFDWIFESPRFIIVIPWRLKGWWVKPDVPRDQAYRTWQRLIAECVDKGLDREKLRSLVCYINS